MNSSTYFNYNLPQPNDMADISKVNTNFINLDAYLHRTIGENYSDTRTLDARIGLLLDNLAPEYDSTSTYAVDDVVIYDGILYQCTTAVTVAEDFDDTKWQQTTIIELLGGA